MPECYGELTRRRQCAGLNWSTRFWQLFTFRSVHGAFMGRRRELFRRSGPRGAVDEDFAQFVAERSAALLRTAWLLTGDAGRAEDLSIAETADILGRSAATVRVQAGRALAALRIDTHVTAVGNDEEVPR
jgi:hypothetical protein